jgi:hypothetical protein
MRWTNQLQLERLARFGIKQAEVDLTTCETPGVAGETGNALVAVVID